jgi:hypothetical protein
MISLTQISEPVYISYIYIIRTSDSFTEHSVQRGPVYTISFSTVQYSTVYHCTHTTVRTVVHPVLPYNVVINHIVQLLPVRVYYTSVQSIYFRDQSNLFRFKNALFQDNPVYELSGNPDYNYEEGAAEK